jgi:hypothetical protein
LSPGITGTFNALLQPQTVPFKKGNMTTREGGLFSALSKPQKALEKAKDEIHQAALQELGTGNQVQGKGCRE